MFNELNVIAARNPVCVASGVKDLLLASVSRKTRLFYLLTWHQYTSGKIKFLLAKKYTVTFNFIQNNIYKTDKSGSK